MQFTQKQCKNRDTAKKGTVLLALDTTSVHCPQNVDVIVHRLTQYFLCSQWRFGAHHN